MFTGIIEATGEVVTVLTHDDIVELTVRSPISVELEVDQSVCHDGVCLTIVHVSEEMHRVQIVHETCERSTFKHIKKGDIINLERSMPANGRFEGHIVQGHVDTTGTFISIENGIYLFRYPTQYAQYLVDKGSVCINGVSLTVARLAGDTFGVAIIPYTLEYTNFHYIKPETEVNLEFDILGKYILRRAELQEE